MAEPTYMDLIGKLDLELSKIAPAECPGLLAELERLKALAWVRLTTPSHGTGELSQPGNQLLTIPQVSERLALPVGRVYELARQGKLPVVRVGKYVRVHSVQLAGWIRDRRDLAVDKNVSFKDTRDYANDRLRAATVSSEDGPHLERYGRSCRTALE
ncbi:MAG: helix-turn-helix domain-containing protein [Nitrospirae bacterium]|nr:helix-turn-helix domain-containing protein [Nitrospirota bacterium]MBU6483114.1 helix-turn-helix domain-containing protein [Nitrospirota bacterium]MDE3040439.1 helix-turn-helix domain-containing protein [Nitrospirota bacterium]